MANDDNGSGNLVDKVIQNQDQVRNVIMDEHLWKIGFDNARAEFSSGPLASLTATTLLNLSKMPDGKLTMGNRGSKTYLEVPVEMLKAVREYYTSIESGRSV